MSLSWVQSGPGAAGTGSVTCTLASPSAPGSMLAAAVFMAAGGTPFTAPAGWVRAASAGGIPVISGTNNADWAALTGSGVTGLSSSLAYNSRTAGTGTRAAFTAAGTPSVLTVSGAAPAAGTRGKLSGSPLPAGLTAGTSYWAVSPSGSTFSVAASLGGAPAGGGTGSGYWTPYTGVPAAWPGPGNVFAPGVAIQVVDFAPDVPMVISGALDSALTAFFAGAPAGSWIMPYHEVNSNGNQNSFGYTAAQIRQMDARILSLAHAVSPALKVGRGFAVYDVFRNGQNLAPWVTPGMDFYGMDGYQASVAGNTPSYVFSGALAAIRAVQPGAAVAIIETGTALDVTAWFDAVYSYAAASSLLAVQSWWGTANGSSQNWSGSFTAEIQKVVNELAAGTPEDAEIWYYPGSPGGISSAVFGGPAGVACAGQMMEFAADAGTVQLTDGTPGTAHGPGPALSLAAATAGSSVAGDLGIAAYGSSFSPAPSGTWTAPAGWTAAGQNGASAQSWLCCYQAGLPGGTQSAAAAFSTTSGQQAWASVLAVFTETFPPPPPGGSGTLAASALSGGAWAPLGGVRVLSSGAWAQAAGLHALSGGAWS